MSSRAFVFGLTVGLVLALMRLSSILPYRWFATAYIELFRGLPALLVLGLWFLFQLVDGSAALMSPQEGGGVAFFAHIGGFVFGFLVVKLVQQRRPLSPRGWGSTWCPGVRCSATWPLSTA